MLRGLYTAASGMIAQQRKHDTVTNNIANINTPGFKQGTGISRSFPEMLIERIRSGGAPGEPPTARVGRLTTGVMAEENVSVHAQGDIQETQNPYDFALISDIQVPGATFDASGKYVDADGQRVIQPQAFFTVLNANGEQRYSLNGKFTVDVNGNLITSEGNRVAGRDGQPIVLIDPTTQAPITNFRISKSGLFTNRDGQPIMGANNQPLNLLISRVEDPNQLVREGNGLYRLNADNATQVQPVGLNDQVEVRQGYIERSNVDAGQSMVDMMSALRAYEANQKVVQFYDKSMEKAVNDVGRI
ncbi:flagellar hook-basal body protein [Paenibacillus hamazuiensis]|uniref:flagellar hook-basal body protein n=1 Tax=Paenibacillus hamazuiensis TaxID=2936508 RepID=UPI00200E1281|nr:flagellar hook-basal body protein [Paenibacillus hamazuiensis]